MAHPWHHALSSVKQWGGVPADYQAIHDWFDETKAHFGDFRHRALRHHTQGIFDAEAYFGVTIVNSDGREIPVRMIAEQHVREDCGFLPTVQDWLKKIEPEGWMNRKSTLNTALLEQQCGERLPAGVWLESEAAPTPPTAEFLRQVAAACERVDLSVGAGHPDGES